jgi:hypothetical protein
MTLTVLSKIMEIVVKSYSLTRVLNRLLNFISERGSQNITDSVWTSYKIIIRLNPVYTIKVSVITGGVLNGKLVPEKAQGKEVVQFISYPVD